MNELEVRRAFRQHIYVRTIEGQSPVAIASALRCTQRAVRSELLRLVQSGYLSRGEGERYVATDRPLAVVGVRTATARVVTLVELLHRRLRACEAEARTVKAQIEQTHPCDRGTLRDLWAEGAAVAAEARALALSITGLTLGVFSDADVEALLAEVRRGDLSGRGAREDMRALEAAMAARAEAKALMLDARVEARVLMQGGAS